MDTVYFTSSQKHHNFFPKGSRDLQGWTYQNSESVWCKIRTTSINSPKLCTLQCNFDAFYLGHGQVWGNGTEVGGLWAEDVWQMESWDGTQLTVADEKTIAGFTHKWKATITGAFGLYYSLFKYLLMSNYTIYAAAPPFNTILFKVPIFNNVISRHFMH